MTGTPARMRVDLGERGYDIVVGHDLLCQAGTYLAPVLKRPRVAIVTDETVAGLHLDTVSAALREAGITVDAITVPSGEHSKSMEELSRLLDRMLDLKIERNDTIVALGGGVVGDLAGFAAAILRRGVDFVQMPTTLLAQVDSSVGGKTGINTRHGKNLIGAFHQPRLVLADVGALATLPARELKAGYAEVVKHGLLSDFAFFEWLESNGAAVLAGDPAGLTHAVLTSCRIKSDIVARDERESDVRALLNLGHTFAHAYEAEGRGGDILHGEAVAAGMIQAMDLSQHLGHCPAQDVERVRRHFGAVALPRSRADLGLAATTTARLIEHMRQDKKVSDGRITFVLVRGIGDAFISKAVPEQAVLDVLSGDTEGSQ